MEAIISLFSFLSINKEFIDQLKNVQKIFKHTRETDRGTKSEQTIFKIKKKTNTNKIRLNCSKNKQQQKANSAAYIQTTIRPLCSQKLNNSRRPSPQHTTPSQLYQVWERRIEDPVYLDLDVSDNARRMSNFTLEYPSLFGCPDVVDSASKTNIFCNSLNTRASSLFDNPLSNNCKGCQCPRES